MNNLDWEAFKTSVADYVGVEVEEVTEETNLYEDLMMDSLGLFSLGIFLMNEYKLQMPIASVATIETVKDIYEMMNEKGTVINE